MEINKVCKRCGLPRKKEEDRCKSCNRARHKKYYSDLQIQRVIWEKSQNENSVNCWNSVIVFHTTAWLEMTGAKVIKMEEFANQQPSIVIQDKGSETRDGTSLQDDDIVQTARGNKLVNES
jgi:hypothetical protein